MEILNEAPGTEAAPDAILPMMSRGVIPRMPGPPGSQKIS